MGIGPKGIEVHDKDSLGITSTDLGAGKRGLDVSGSFSVSSEFPTASALGDGTANPTTTVVGSFIHGFNGTSWDRLRSSVAMGLTVAGTTLHEDPITDYAVRIAGMDETQTNQLDVTVSSSGNKFCLDVNIAEATGEGFDVNTELAPAVTLTDGAGNPIVPVVGAYDHVFNGVTWDRMRGDVTNGLDVDVTRISPGTGASDLGKADDAAHTSGDVGVMALAVRNDSGGVLAGTDLDYVPLTTDNTGALRVTSSGGGAGTQYTEGDTDASITGTAIMFESDTGTNTLSVVNQTTPLPVETVGSTLVQGTEADGDTVAANALRIAGIDGTLTTQLDITVTPSGGKQALDVNIAEATGEGFDVNTELGTPITLTDGAGNPIAPVVGSYDHLFNGVTWDRTPGDATNGTLVNLGANNDVTVSGTVSITGAIDTELPAAASLGDATANPSTTSVGALLHGFNGTTWDRLRSTTANGLQVDVTQVVPGTGATALGKAEDSAAASGDVGVLMLAMRHSSDTTTVSADGDYTALHVNPNGFLKVFDNAGFTGNVLINLYDNTTGQQANVLNTEPVGSENGLVVRVIPHENIAQLITGSLTSVFPGAGATSLGKAEDAVHTSGDVGVAALAIRHDANTTTVSADGDYANLHTDASGLLKASLSTATAAPGGAAPAAAVMAGTKDVFGGYTVPRTFSVLGVDLLLVNQLDASLTALDYRSDGVMMSAGGSTDDTHANGHFVNIDSNRNTVVVGSIAHDAADSGNPVKVGGKANSSFITAVASGDRTDLTTDLYGRMRVVAHPDDIKRLGVYFQTSGAITVQAAADAATAGHGWLINPVGSAVTARVRKILFRSQLGGVLASPTSPRINIERVTFTGTASGGTVTAAKRKTADATQVTSFRTASTGLSLSAGAVVCDFLPVASATAVGFTDPVVAEFDAFLEDYVDLAAGEGLVIRQPDAGTAADSRRYTVTFVVEEF